jgi:hypothetical protein
VGWHFFLVSTTSLLDGFFATLPEKKNGQIAHRTTLPTSRNQELLRNLAICHAQAIHRAFTLKGLTVHV